jgi:hypothetical protein
MEILLAILVSGLALVSLPRRRVRENLAAASRLGRLQYGLVVGPSLLFTAILWLDIWFRGHGQNGGQFFPLILLAGAAWFMVLAASGLPALWRRRTR